MRAAPTTGVVEPYFPQTRHAQDIMIPVAVDGTSNSLLALPFRERSARPLQ